MIKDKKLYRILVMEDNPGDFVLVESFLAEEFLNAEIIHAKSFAHGALALSQADAPFDIILLDLTLPDKSGQELVADMVRVAANCPIIILTGYTDIDFSIKSISLGILDYLIKDDLNPVTLYKSIIYAIERKHSISELEASEKRYSDLFHLSPQPMWVFDSETYRFSQVNNAAVSLYGYSEEEFLSMSVMDIKPQEDIAKSAAHISQMIMRNEAFKTNARHNKKSGETIEVEIYSNPIVIGGKRFISVIVIDVTEKKLYEHKIIKAIIKTQEDERYEIGGELHDNVCQLLAVSQLSLKKMSELLPPSGRSYFEQCGHNIRLALEEIRNLSHRLAPVFFDDSKMGEAFERLFKTFNINKELELVLYVDNDIEAYPLSVELQLNLYRILQEQLRNIQKHARATRIEVDVLIFRNTLKMRISDDGVGFNIHSLKRGIGLANMKRRAELFAGKLEVNSSPGNGCEIVVSIPLQKEEALKVRQ